MTSDFQSSLVRHLLAEKRYGDAIKVAKLNDYSEEPTNNLAMIRAVLAEDSLSDLERAEMLWEYGDRMRLTSSDPRWQDCLNTAAELYSKAGHASGALEMRVDLIRHAWDQSVPADEYTAELWQIMAKIESIGNWTAANRCLAAITEINTGEYRVPPEALQVKIEEEWARLTDICASNVGRTGSSVYKVMEWQSRKSRGASGLDYLERLYDKVKDCDAPAMLSVILTTMHDAYKALGEDQKAFDCLKRRPELLPRQFQAILGIDPFQEALIAATEAKDTETELAGLAAELKEVQDIIRRAPGVLARDTEVERLSNLCNYYVMQHAFRGHEQVEKLIDCAEPVLLEACEGLEEWRATVWRAKALQTRSLLTQVKSQQARTMEELLSFTNESTEYYQQSVDLFNASERPLDWRASSAKTLLANSLALLWSLKGRPASSEDFTSAAKLYAEAVGSGPLTMQKATCISLLRHWVDGIGAKIEVDPTIFGTSSAYEMAIKWANEADRLETIQRNDLSALPRERAVLAKQEMTSKRDPKHDFYLLALLLHDSVDDNIGAWKWLAKSKARSISDMLGLGINIPKTLRFLIESDAELVEMCETEKVLIQQLSKATEDQQFLFRTKIEAHRDEMRKKPVLKQLLSYREGQPTSLEKLQSISAQASPKSARRIFYVDWFIFSGLCFAFVATSAGVDTFATGVSAVEVAGWKAQYLNSDASTGRHPLDENKAEPLQKLSKLIQPLLKPTSPGDIIVFCPTGVLHGVPLHAATLEDTSTKTLLERNPVVYTASMTTFEQCVSKESERVSGIVSLTNALALAAISSPETADDGCSKINERISRSYVAVYERTEKGPLNELQTKQRDAIYAMVGTVAGRHLTSALGTTKVILGNETTRDKLVSAFETDYMYFFGHCKSSATNMLLQGLVLGNALEKNGDDEEHEMFTASDMFTITINTSCVTLLACGSAHEAHTSQGDEPLGIVSAMLCAGATSVIGTMWKVQVGTARLFTDLLDRNMSAAVHEEDGNQRGLVDLAVAVQTAALRLKSRQQGGTRHPYHWAAFVLNGSWFMAR